MPGVDAFGTQFKRETDTPDTFELIANVSNLSGPSRERESIDVTAHNSADKYREFVKGLKNGGEVTVTINYDPTLTDTASIEADFEEEDNRNYRIVLLPGEDDEWTWDFEGLITGLSDEFPIDDRMEREMTIQISGKPVLTATGGS